MAKKQKNSKWHFEEASGNDVFVSYDLVCE